MTTEDYRQLKSAEVARKRHALIVEMGKLEEEMNRRRQEDRHLTRAEDLEWKDTSDYIGARGNRRTSRATAVAPELGCNVHNFAAFFTEVPPGSEEGSYHMHGEAVKYYIQGKGIEIIGDKRYEVKAGDVVFVPANTWHGTQNPGPEVLKFLAVAGSGLGVPVFVQSIFKTKE